MMTASELVENAVKYGEDVPAARCISFALTVDDETIRIEVSNGSTDKDGVRNLQSRVNEIARTPDKAALYVARLEKLLIEPAENGNLGLYRIAFEGQFDLACRYVDEVVTVTATRTG